MNRSPETYLQALDQERLSSVLGSMRQSGTFQVADWQYQSLTKGSVSGNAFRASGNGTDNGTRVHWSLILKFIPSPASIQAGSIPQFGDDSTRWNYWKREMLFYQSDLPDSLPSGLTAPDCYHIDEQPDGCWLWLEDIADVYEQRWPIARFGVAAQHLARFSGAYLVGKDIPTYAWLTKDQDFIRDWESQITSVDALSRVEQLRQEHPLIGRGWPEDVIAGFSRNWQERERFFEVLDGLPKTLQHADSANKNLMARRDHGEEETVALDWAMVGIGTIGEEIASLVFGTLEHGGAAMTDASELEEIVLDGYVRGLRDAGWNGDPKLVQLGYLASVVLGYGFFVTMTPEFFVMNSTSNMKRIEAIYRQPIEVVVDSRVELRRFILARADQARALMAGT